MKQRKTTLQKETVIGCAASLFLTHGIEDVKMTDIADAAGVGVASLYRHFQTKERLAILSGSFLWKDLHVLFERELKPENLADLSGMEQIERMLGIYQTLYREHADFIRFLSSFDDLMLREKVPKKELLSYEESVLDFYPLFEKAYQTGTRDGSVREIPDPKAFYETTCHAAIALSQKLLRGEILSADGFCDAREIDLLLEMAAQYLKK